MNFNIFLISVFHPQTLSPVSIIQGRITPRIFPTISLTTWLPNQRFIVLEKLNLCLSSEKIYIPFRSSQIFLFISRSFFSIAQKHVTKFVCNSQEFRPLIFEIKDKLCVSNMARISQFLNFMSDILPENSYLFTFFFRYY